MEVNEHRGSLEGVQGVEGAFLHLGGPHMKQWNSTLERHTELHSKTELRSSKPIRPVNRERKAQLEARNFGEQAVIARSMRCCGCGLAPPSDAAHSEGRKMGGCGGDRFAIVPLCRTNVYTGRPGCHHLYDNDIEAFTMRTGLSREDVRTIARKLWGVGP